MKILYVLSLLGFCTAVFAAEPSADAGQRRVTQGIEAWNACLRDGLELQIKMIASPSFIADAILEQCDAPFLELQQLMLEDMQARDQQRDEQKTQQIVLESLRDAKENHRAKIISIVMKQRTK